MWNVICCLVSAWAQPAHVPTQPQLHPGLPVSWQRLGLHPDRGNPSQGQTSRQTFHHTHPHEDWLPGARDHGAGHGHEPTEVRSRGHSVEQNSTQGQCIYCFFLYSSSNNFDEDLLICSIWWNPGCLSLLLHEMWIFSKWDFTNLFFLRLLHLCKSCAITDI